MSFEKDYNTLIKITTAKIRSKKLFDTEASDLVNECYIILIEKKIDYSLNEATKIINSLCFKEFDKPIHSGINDLVKSKKFYTSNSRPCKFCSEEKPINCFRIRNNSTMRRDTMCDDCRNKEAREYWKKNKEVRIKKGLEYWKKNKETLNAYRRSIYVSKRKSPKKEKIIKPPRVLKVKEIKLKIKIIKTKYTSYSAQLQNINAFENICHMHCFEIIKISENKELVKYKVGYKILSDLINLGSKLNFDNTCLEYHHLHIH